MGWKNPAFLCEKVEFIPRLKPWAFFSKVSKEVKILTARVASGKEDTEVARKAIEEFLEEQFGQVLEITNEKDHKMLELWDDRVVQVIPNTGERADGKD